MADEKMADDVAYVYIGAGGGGGNGDFIPGVPARNLTRAEYRDYQEDIDANLASPRPLYVAVKKGQSVEDALAQPWQGYDEQTVDEIVPQLASLNDTQRAQVAAYEEEHKNRRGIMDALAEKEGGKT